MFICWRLRGVHAIRGTFFRSKSLSPHSNSTFLSPVFVGIVRTLCCALAKSSYDLIPVAGEIVVQPMSSLWYLLILLTCHYVVMCNPNVSAKSRGYVFFLFTQFVVSWGLSVIGICESFYRVLPKMAILLFLLLLDSNGSYGACW